MTEHRVVRLKTYDFSLVIVRFWYYTTAILFDPRFTGDIKTQHEGRNCTLH